MNKTMKIIPSILLYILLPLIAVLLFPPSILSEGLTAIATVAVAFVLLGFMLYQGRTWALTLMIFIQGFNVIVRLMMLLRHASPAPGQIDYIYIVTAIAAISLSMWLLLRLDKPDIRVRMIR